MTQPLRLTKTHPLAGASALMCELADQRLAAIEAEAQRIRAHALETLARELGIVTGTPIALERTKDGAYQVLQYEPAPAPAKKKKAPAAPAPRRRGKKGGASK